MVGSAWPLKQLEFSAVSIEDCPCVDQLMEEYLNINLHPDVRPEFEQATCSDLAPLCLYDAGLVTPSLHGVPLSTLCCETCAHHYVCSDVPACADNFDGLLEVDSKCATQLKDEFPHYQIECGSSTDPVSCQAQLGCMWSTGSCTSSLSYTFADICPKTCGACFVPPS
jgi:hypothetical protein